MSVLVALNTFFPQFRKMAATRVPASLTHHPPMLIMIAGWAGSGKDCAAALLAEEFGFQRFAFADALKADVSRSTGIPLECFHSAQKDRPLAEPCKVYPTAKTPREVLIQHALVCREADPDIYSRGVATEIQEATGRRFGLPHSSEEVHTIPHMGRYVISDWRYLREHQVVASELGEFCQIFRVRIVRPGIKQSAEPSEHDLDGLAMDYVLHNDGSISDLRHAVKHFFHLTVASATVDKSDTRHST